MNDLEKMKQAFTDLKIEFEVVTAKEEHGSDIHTSHYHGKITWDTVIKLDNGIGYYSFKCLFYFLEGNYKGHGVWE